VKVPSQRRAIGEMIFAGAIWGYGFIATKYALASFGTLTLTILRFALSAAVILPLVYFFSTFKSDKHGKLARWAILPGLCLAGLMIFQTWGLKYTSATRSGFITTLYVVLVPLFEVLILKRKLKYEHLLWVALALIGTALICDVQGGDWNIGDGLTFIGAIAAALHIIVIAKVSARVDSPMAFNGYQNVICALCAVVLVPVAPETTGTITGLSLYGLLFLTFASTTLAFMLQIRAQQVLSPSTASLLFLLESPFAALSGFLFLGEFLSFNQWIGAILILASAFLCVRRQIASV
jgi:drug/metabolite transporter (DMT)-like permease